MILPAEYTPQDPFSMLFKDLSEQQRVEISAAEQARANANAHAARLMTDTMFDALQKRVPMWVCHHVCDTFALNNMTSPTQFGESPLSKILEKAANENLDFRGLHFKFCLRHLERQKKLFSFERKDRESEISEATYTELLEISYFLSETFGQLSVSPGLPGQHIGYNYDKSVKLFKRIQEIFPAGPFPYDDWQVFATILGVGLEAAARSFPLDRWVNEFLRCSIPYRRFGNKQAAKWEENELTFEKSVEPVHRYEEDLAQRSADDLAAIISLKIFEPNLAGKVHDLTAIKNRYKNLGSMNGWGESPPELYQTLKTFKLPIERVSCSGTGNVEIFASHHLRFYYTVYSD